MEIKKVARQGETKIVIIPKNSDIFPGDYVMITKIENSGDEIKIQ